MDFNSDGLYGSNLNRHVNREFNPSFKAKKQSLSSFSYPAIITIQLCLCSLSASHNVSTHSFAKLSRFSELPSEYASSINNTPPNDALIISFVLIAVCPKYPATRSFRLTFLNTFLFKIPRLLKIRPMIFATSVFPEPGGP